MPTSQKRNPLAELRITCFETGLIGRESAWLDLATLSHQLAQRTTT